MLGTACNITVKIKPRKASKTAFVITHLWIVAHLAKIQVVAISPDIHFLKSSELIKMVLGSWSVCGQKISRMIDRIELKF